MIDLPEKASASDGDAHAQPRVGLPQAVLVTLAQEVINHLAKWPDRATAPPRKAVRLRVVPDVQALSDALVGRDPDKPKQLILTAHKEGATHEELCLFHISAAAQRLGVMWEDDEVTFTDMAVAAGRMLSLLRDLRTLIPQTDLRGERCALIATVPGETHSIGATMAADLFRERGWDIDLRMGHSGEELAQFLRTGGYPIVGLSASTPERIQPLARTVLELRIVAPEVLIFVGGGVVRLDPGIADRVGADAAAWEPGDCFDKMEGLYRELWGDQAP